VVQAAVEQQAASDSAAEQDAAERVVQEGGLLRLAVDRTLEAGTARTWHERIRQDRAKRSVSAGVVDFARCREWQLRFRPRPDFAPTPDAALERLGRIYQFVSIRTDVYAYSRLKGRPWARCLRHRDAAPADGPGDPEGLVECLAGALDEVRVIGQEALLGAQATQYRAMLLERAAQRLPTGARWRVLQHRNGEQALLPADVWLDGEGRLRRLAFRRAFDPALREPYDVVFDLYGFGIEARIRLPGPRWWPWSIIPAKPGLHLPTAP